ncbi:MAG: endonuclease [Candidatus Cloacimonadota bacterium]|nr:MAG: endonuclease [Candidatus Cloacimonadota bacterium]PIE78679.1 MAG: endonuclease [Candidatus Delongbacteria bacterium]
MIKEKDTSISVMSFNIRYDYPNDRENNWKYRKKRVVNAILFYHPDILGAQEVLHNQLEDLKIHLQDYNVVGVGREDGKTKGEYSAIFYKKDRFEEIDTGYFWLSENPDAVGTKGWDSACERIATWIKLKDLRSEKILFILNTHLDHVGKKARKESVNLILNRLESLAKNLPIVVTGDFNSSPNSSYVKDITDKDDKRSLTNSREISEIVYGPNFTFHNFGKTPFEERTTIDYIFVKNNIKVLKHGVLAETDGKEFLSDHTPIIARVVI